MSEEYEFRTQLFRKRYLKERTMESLICYCSGYTTSDIELDVLENSNSTIIEKIMFEKKPVDATAPPRTLKVADAFPTSARWWTTP